MRILICMLSGQHVPNLLVVHTIRPEKLLLVETAEMKKKNAAKYFLNALSFSGLDYRNNGRSEIISLSNENSIAKMVELLSKHYINDDMNEWLVNLTGGTKLMAIGAYSFFKEKKVKMLYLPDTDQSHVLDAVTGQQESEQKHKVSIKAFLAGYGFELYEDGAEKWKKLARKWSEFATWILANCNDEKLLDELASFNAYINDKKGRWLRDEIFTPKFAEYLVKYEDVIRNGKKIRGNVGPDMVNFLCGKWLEVFIYHVFLKYAEALGLWDVQIGVRLKADGTEFENELDVAFIRDQSLYIVECKTGEQTHDREVGSLYKLEAIKKQFGALRVSSYFASTSPNILENGRIKTHLETRAKLYNCRIITRDKLSKLAKTMMSSNNEDELVKAIKTTFMW